MDQEDNKSEGAATILIASMVYQTGANEQDKEIHDEKSHVYVSSPVATEGPGRRL